MRIGIIDSGSGGMSIADQLVQHDGFELYYCADYQNVPYGDKSAAEIVQLSSVLIDRLLACNVDMIVIACHTICVSAFDYLVRLAAPVPVLGVDTLMIEYGLSSIKKDCIGLVATSATIATQSYQRRIAQLYPDAVLSAHACPDLATLIELRASDATLKQAVAQYVVPLIAARVDTILLGCTHYALIKNIFYESMPYPVILISAEQYIDNALSGYCSSVSRSIPSRITFVG